MASSNCGCVRNVDEKASSRHWSFRMMNLWTRFKKYNFQTSPWNIWQHKNVRRAGFVKNKFIFLWWGMDRLKMYSPLFQRRLWMQGRHNREYQNSWLRRNICKGSNFLYEFNRNNKYYITLFLIDLAAITIPLGRIKQLDARIWMFSFNKRILTLIHFLARKLVN